MAVTGIGNSYHSNVYESSSVSQNKEEAKKAETKEKAPAQAGNEKSARSSAVSEYYSHLRENYSGIADGSVTISGEYLKKCAGNAAKAKELENFLQKIPELEKQGYEQLSSRNKALGGTVTYYQQTWTVNKDGSIQSTVYSVTETGMTNAERMKKNIEERLERQKEKKEEQKIKEQREEKKEQTEKSEEDTKNNAVPEIEGPNITIRYVQAESEAGAKAMMKKEMPADAYYQEFDRQI